MFEISKMIKTAIGKILKMKWWKGGENEHERIVHEDKIKFNIWGSRRFKYVKREN